MWLSKKKYNLLLTHMNIMQLAIIQMQKMLIRQEKHDPFEIIECGYDNSKIKFVMN